MEVEVKGEWLERAIHAQQISVYALAKQLGTRPDKFYQHISNKAHLSAESLAELALKFPSMNMRFVLTGQGEPVTP